MTSYTANWNVFCCLPKVGGDIFLNLSQQSALNGSFYVRVLVADAVLWTACQAAGGHLAHLEQTVSRSLLSIRGRWGTEWDNHSTGDGIALLTVQMCLRQWPIGPRVLSPTDKMQVDDQRASGMRVDTLRNIWIWFATQLLCDCCADLTHSNCMRPCARHQLVSTNPNFYLAHTSAHKVNSCVKKMLSMSNQNIVVSQPSLFGL